MFYTLSKTEIIIYITLILSSANAFNLDKVKLLSSVNGLRLAIPMAPHLDDRYINNSASYFYCLLILILPLRGELFIPYNVENKIVWYNRVDRYRTAYDIQPDIRSTLPGLLSQSIIGSSVGFGDDPSNHPSIHRSIHPSIHPFIHSPTDQPTSQSVLGMNLSHKSHTEKSRIQSMNEIATPERAVTPWRSGERFLVVEETLVVAHGRWNSSRGALCERYWTSVIAGNRRRTLARKKRLWTCTKFSLTRGFFNI